MTSDEERLKDLLSKAQDLVKDVDSELKTTAFTIILNKLLDTEVPSTASKKTTKVRTQRRNIEEEDQISGGRGGPKDRVRELITDNFFEQPKSMKNILDELGSRSFHYKDTDLTRQMQELVREKQLRRLKQPNEKGRQVTHWVKW